MSRFSAEYSADFSKSFRGFDVSEVQHFVYEINLKFDELIQKLEEKESQIRSLEIELEKYKQLENSMLKAIEMADKHQKEWVETQKSQLAELEKQAKEKSDLIIENAQKEAKKWKILEENSIKSQKNKLAQEFLEAQREIKAIKEAKKQISEEITHLLASTKNKIKPEKSNKNPVKKAVSSKPKSKNQVESKKIASTKKVRSTKKSVPDDGLPTVAKVLKEFNKKGGEKGNIAELT